MCKVQLEIKYLELKAKWFDRENFPSKIVYIVHREIN